MDRISKLKMKGLESEDIFSIYTEYIRHSIVDDLKKIYGEETELMESTAPWVYRVRKG
ncbi:MAG: hypothetical protein ISS91_00565 [Candidatus Omnitrophica bacterium]|nr:hypothetical protein [Candidatus Omnitrophota bacterium]